MSAILLPSRRRQIKIETSYVRLDGKFFRLGDEKFCVKGVSYGPFAPGADGLPWPDRKQVDEDLQQISNLDANCIRIYHVPPVWLLDASAARGIKIFLDVAWPKNISFDSSPDILQAARDAVRTAAKLCGNHPALFAISVANEFPPDLVRFIGPAKVERLINELVRVAKTEAPNCLVTFANFPATEYLNPSGIDFHCFNVYLHDEQIFRNYLARLQSIRGDKPLILGECGIDTHHEQNESQQAITLAMHLHGIFEEGLAGVFIFSFTDDWFTRGYQVEDWKFGLTHCDRSPKPAYSAVRNIFQMVPQTFAGRLPMASVIICSYNGAATLNGCLRSMEKLRYPLYEIIVVDDGSTDNTQSIVQQFSSIRVVHQKHQGLAAARNSGLAAARGEVVVFTDSDCEADEDWLYHLMVTLLSSPHAGVGGPNLIPDENSWVADCVGLSPGGPTHVMIDDRTAEHVPGCNMGFYVNAARQINGFDNQFHTAGDDVDFIWRLQDAGFTIGFSPGAQVWHYRRNSISAYLKQQRGYGEAEALLKFKHPNRFNRLGASHWRGRLYGGGEIGVPFGRNVIYHGIFGTALFQTIYRRPASMAVMIMMSIEWHLLTISVAVFGLAFLPLMWVAGAMMMTPILLASVAAIQSRSPRYRHLMSRLLIGWLHYRQPIARGWARYSFQLKNRVIQAQLPDLDRTIRLPFAPCDRSTLLYWSMEDDRFRLLAGIEQAVTNAGLRQKLDSGWDEWDIELYASRYVKIRLTTATELHDAGGKLTRIRVRSWMSTFNQCLFAASLILGTTLLIHLSRYNAPLVLIPLAVRTHYLLERRRSCLQILGMIHDVASKAAFWPVYPKKSCEEDNP